MRIAVVLLAAGRSTRFGDANKTMAPLHGIPLGEHAARTLAAGLAASGDGRRVLLPAIFGSDWFDALEGLSGDRRARDLLDRATVVNADPAALTDIDTRDQLAAAQRQRL